MNIRVVESLDEIPEGAKRIHLYSFDNLLRPRGGLAQKESLSFYIIERLKDCFESWTDKKYGDSKDKQTVLLKLRENLEQEVNIAWSLFLQDLGEKEPVQPIDEEDLNESGCDTRADE